MREMSGNRKGNSVLQQVANYFVRKSQDGRRLVEILVHATDLNNRLH